MHLSTRRSRGREEGYALLAVTVFALVLTIAGMGFYTMATFETKGALYRENSSKAFYAADGAVEVARAQFLADRTWRPDSTRTYSMGSWTYTLKSKDTSFGGYSNVVRLTATGHAMNANRSVEVMTRVPPTAEDLAILIVGDVGNNAPHGNLTINGDVHVNGDPQDIGDHINGSLSSGFAIDPPAIYTDPGHFPNSTYYYVKCDKTGPKVQVQNAAGVNITAGHDMTGWVAYNNGSQTFTISFTGNRFSTYFGAGGFFPPAPGATTTVVNFGEAPINPGTGKTALSFDGVTGSITATIIGTRFTGVTLQDRLNTTWWTGALTTVKQTIFEPRNGIALIAYDLDVDTQGFGTSTWPALVYLTHDLVDTHGNSQLFTGSLICLNDLVDAHGNALVTYNAGFIANLPDYLRNDWQSGVAGTMKILRWREVGI
jgi:hypothetical protein